MSPGGDFSRAKKSLGQNFLVDANLQNKIVEALGAGPDDEVLEVGPGRGALTRHLVDRVGRLVLVELDDALAAVLDERYGGRDDVNVVKIPVSSKTGFLRQVRGSGTTPTHDPPDVSITWSSALVYSSISILEGSYAAQMRRSHRQGVSSHRRAASRYCVLPSIR